MPACWQVTYRTKCMKQGEYCFYKAYGETKEEAREEFLQGCKEDWQEMFGEIGVVILRIDIFEGQMKDFTRSKRSDIVFDDVEGDITL